MIEPEDLTFIVILVCTPIMNLLGGIASRNLNFWHKRRRPLVLKFSFRMGLFYTCLVIGIFAIGDSMLNNLQPVKLFLEFFILLVVSTASNYGIQSRNYDLQNRG